MTLKRTGPPARRTPLKQRTRVNPVSPRRRKRDAQYAEQRRRLWVRAQGQCEFHPDGRRCPRFADDCHHLAGRLGPDPHRLDNLVALCRWHHDLAHQMPAWAYSVGLLVHRHRTGEGDAA